MCTTSVQTGGRESASRNGFSPQRQKQRKHKFSTDKHKHTQADEGIPGFPKDFTYQELELSGRVISVFVLLQSTPSRGPIQQRPLRQYEAQTLRGSRIVFLSFLYLLLLTASTGRNAFFNLSGIRGGSLGFYGTHPDFCISSPASP